MDWFLYDIALRRERVKVLLLPFILLTYYASLNYYVFKTLEHRRKFQRGKVTTFLKNFVTSS